MQSSHQPFATTAIIYLVVFAVVVWRMARPQRMSVLRLWIMPLVLLGLTAFSLWANAQAAAALGQTPPALVEVVAVLIAGALLGIPLGFLRGKHSVVKPTETPGIMYVHSSPLIILIWIGALAVRMLLRTYLPNAQGLAVVGGDGLLAFAIAALITSYYAIYQKYRLALQQAPAA